MWGNPIAEVMYETLRYFSGALTPTSAFTYSGTTDDSTLGLPLPTWQDPYDPNTGHPYCSKPFMLVISDINPNYDTDQLPGSYFGSFGGSLGHPECAESGGHHCIPRAGCGFALHRAKRDQFRHVLLAQERDQLGEHPRPVPRGAHQAGWILRRFRGLLWTQGGYPRRRRRRAKRGDLCRCPGFAAAQNRNPGGRKEDHPGALRQIHRIQHRGGDHPGARRFSADLHHRGLLCGKLDAHRRNLSSQL